MGNEGSCPIVESHLVLVRLTILDDIKRDDGSCLGNAIAHVAEDTGALAKASACALPLGLRVALRLCPQLTLRDARIAREAGVTLGVHRSPYRLLERRSQLRGRLSREWIQLMREAISCNQHAISSAAASRANGSTSRTLPSKSMALPAMA